MLQVWGIVSFVILWVFIGGFLLAMGRAIQRLERGVAQQRDRQGL